MTTAREVLPKNYNRIFVEKVSKASVMKYDKKLYNTNNCGGEAPENYHQQSALHQTRNWVSAPEFKRRYYSSLTIPGKHVEDWMIDAAEQAQRLGKFPAADYGDDLEELVKILEPEFQKLMDEEKAQLEKDNQEEEVNAGDGAEQEQKKSQDFVGFFIRSEDVSLKDGVHGIGPYKDIRKVIESIVTAHRMHTPLPKKKGTLKNSNPSNSDATADSTTTSTNKTVLSSYKPLQLYLFPWIDDLRGEFECRVFVHKGSVTAISQQHLYKAYPLWQFLSLHELELFAARIVEHYERVVRKVVSVTDTFTYDLGVRLPFTNEERSSSSDEETLTQQLQSPGLCPSTSSSQPLLPDADDEEAQYRKYMRQAAAQIAEEDNDDEQKEKAELTKLQLWRKTAARIVEQGSFHFIESNAFGARYPAGASLFDWIYDDARLCQQHKTSSGSGGNDIFLRFTSYDLSQVDD